MIEDNKKKLVVIRGNLLDRETRATKIIHSASSNGYQVTLIDWDRGGTTPRSEKKEAGSSFQEITFRFPAPWGKIILIFLPFWWSFILIQLLKSKWDIVHAIQVISLPPAILAGILKNKPVIYDMLDTYEDSIPLPKWIRDLCIRIDKILMSMTSCVILADLAQIEEVNGIPNRNVYAIYDSPYTLKNINYQRRKNDVFTLFFAGLLSSEKKLNLDKIFLAIDRINDIKVIIAGYGNLVDEIVEWSNKIPNKIGYIGEIPHSEVLERSIQADLLFVLRDPSVLVNKYICGSKILEALMCSTPLLVSKGTSTANLVTQEKCGIVVDPNNIDEIVTAILKIKNDENLREFFRLNAQNAYNERYSWIIMESRLLKIYNSLIK